MVLPGLRQHPLARLPPGAARPDPRRRRHVLDLARADVRPRRAGWNRTATTGWPGRSYAEMALAGVSAVGEFHYLHHRPDGSRYRRAERVRPGADAGGRRGGHPDHPAGHLLSGRRPGRGRLRAGRRACSGGSATAARPAGRSGSTALAASRRPTRSGSARRSTRCARCRTTSWPRSSRSGGRPAAARARVRAAGREPGLPAAATAVPRPGCWPSTASRGPRTPRCTPPT